MARFVSPFTPRSQYGGALSNLMTAAFADSNEGAGGRRAEYDSERILRESQARKVAAEAALDEQTAMGRRNLAATITQHIQNANRKKTRPLDLSYAPSQDDGVGLRLDDLDPQALFPSDEPTVRALGQGEPGPSLQFDDLDAPMPPSLPLGEQANLRLTDSAPALPDIRIGHGAPGPLSREDQMLLDAGILEAFGLASTSSNPDQYANAYGRLQTQGNERAFLEGDLSGSDLATTLGKDIVGADEGVLYNKFDMDEPFIELPGDPTKGGEWTTGLNPNANNRRERVRLTPGGIPQWSGVETPEPTALIQQYGGPIPAVKRGTDEEVFIQPDRTGGAPVEVQGYAPRESASRQRDSAKVAAGQKAAQDALRQIDDIIVHVTENPSSVGVYGMYGRAKEGVMGQIGQPSGTSASDLQTKQRLLMTTMWRDLVGSGQISKGDYELMDSILRGLGPLDSPETVISAYRLLQDTLRSKINLPPQGPGQRPTATNPETGEKIEWDGSNWVKPQ